MQDEKNLRILIVEDQRDLREILTELLALYQLSADSASNAEQALKLLTQSENGYAGAIIDLGLPGMDGWGLLEIIRSQTTTRDLPCIAMTAGHSTDLRQRALEAGFNAYFAKPFVIQEIIDCLKPPSV